MLRFLQEIPRMQLEQKAVPGIGKVSPRDLVDQMTFVAYFSTSKHNFIQLNCHWRRKTGQPWGEKRKTLNHKYIWATFVGFYCFSVATRLINFCAFESLEELRWLKDICSLSSWSLGKWSFFCAGCLNSESVRKTVTSMSESLHMCLKEKPIQLTLKRQGSNLWTRSSRIELVLTEVCGGPGPASLSYVSISSETLPTRKELHRFSLGSWLPDSRKKKEKKKWKRQTVVAQFSLKRDSGQKFTPAKWCLQRRGCLDMSLSNQPEEMVT